MGWCESSGREKHFPGSSYNMLCFSLRLFLLRDSQSNPKAFVLTLCHHQKIKHFQILPVSVCIKPLHLLSSTEMRNGVTITQI